MKGQVSCPFMAEDEKTVDVVVEIPKGSRNKYEYDHEKHVMRLDRRLFSATVYPADYGFVPDTLGEDGDPLDAMVLFEDPTFPGVWVTARPVGVFWMEDEAGPDAKLICMPEWDYMIPGAESLEDLPSHLLNEIEHFFDVYKDLEPDKHASTNGFTGRDDAWRLIYEARKRFLDNGGTPGQH
jgi:inorganic pyrophosphatase